MNELNLTPTLSKFGEGELAVFIFTNMNMNNKLFLSVDGQDITGLVENPDQDTLVILVHGFTGNMHGHANIFDKLSDKLQSKGCSVLRFNFRGTPSSEGEFIDMTLASETKDLEEIIKYAKSLGYKRIGVLGESMGGSVIVNLPRIEFEFIIFWYPIFEFLDSEFKGYLTAESQKLLKEQGHLTDYGFMIGEEFISQIPMINLFDRLLGISCPTLFLHGDSDTDAPVHQSKKAFELITSAKKIHILNGADHCFENEQDEAIDLTIRFIEGVMSS